MTDSRSAGGKHSWPLFIAIATAVATILPTMLTGALSARMSQDLDFSNWNLGLAVAAFYFCGAASSLVAGRIVQQIGVNLGLRLSAALSLIALLGMAVIQSPLAAVGFLAVGGLGIATAQPAANMVILQHVSPRREGLLFGMKQGALPIAALVSGISIPAVALTLGWRWAFAIAALIPAILTLAPYDADVEPSTRPHYVPVPRPILRAIAPVIGAMAFGSMTGNAVGTFFVRSLVDSGFSDSTAGTLLALGGLAGITGRIASGWISDRSRWTALQLAALMLSIGAVGYLLLTTPLTWTVALATVLSFGFGWGWPGLVHLGVVTAYRKAAGDATGLLQVGALLGAGTGPLLAGLVATAYSFTTLWIVTTCVAIGGAILLLSSARLLRRARTS